MDWLESISREKRARSDAEEDKNSLAVDREVQYKAKAWEFWGEVSDRIEEDIDCFNAVVPREFKVRRELLLGGTRWSLNATVPPRRTLTVLFSFKEHRISCYRLPGKGDQHFLVEVGRDGVLFLTEQGRWRQCPSAANLKRS